jgi:hypothetical protein
MTNCFGDKMRLFGILGFLSDKVVCAFFTVTARPSFFWDVSPVSTLS